LFYSLSFFSSLSKLLTYAQSRLPTVTSLFPFETTAAVLFLEARHGWCVQEQCVSF
jgi:hypothetical protein